MPYYTPPGGLPAQTEMRHDQAVFTTAYAFIPKRVLTDIVASYLPDWKNTRLWVIARPLSGFSETFSHYVMEVAAGGGSERPDADTQAEHVLFVTTGEGRLTAGGAKHPLSTGSYVYLPPGMAWQLHNTGKSNLGFHWIRKRYQPLPDQSPPDLLITSDQDTPPQPMPDCNGVWSTSRFVSMEDMRHDMHVNIVSFQPGGNIPFAETHVMEHGLYVLEGQALYRLNKDWIEVEPGDYMWLRAFCPQCCIASGPGPFRYLLYKDVNRHMPLDLFGRSA